VTTAVPDMDELFDRLVREVPDWPNRGVIFKDITPLLADAQGFRAVVAALAAVAGPAGVDKVVGVEARGFILAAPVAHQLGAGFVPVRKQGKLPWTTHEQSYALEYGEATLAVHTDAFDPGDRVLIVDDVLATGGTAAATANLVERGGGKVIGMAFLVELAFLKGREQLADLPIRALVTR
jgi:adenine phosphoribosyltransferase